MLCLVASALGLQSIVVTASRPALLSSSTVNRCAPPHARMGADGWVDFDDSGDECVVSDEGWTCLGADVAGPIRVDGTPNGLDLGRRSRSPANDEERRRRSPGMMNNFEQLSTEDFKKPFEVEGASAPEVPAVAASSPDLPPAAASAPKVPDTVPARMPAPARKPVSVPSHQSTLATFPQFSSGLLR